MAPDSHPDQIDLAFAGAGWIAAVHGYAIDHVPGLTISKVASRSAARAAEAAARVGAEACTYDDLPAGARGVVVCTPPAQHAEHTLATARGGAGALVEKPLCTTLADADAMVDAAEAGALTAYAENLVHAPAVRLAIAHAAEIGPLDLLEVRALQSRPTWGDFLTQSWGGGVLFDLGAHPLAVALLLAAPARPIEVHAVLDGAGDHPVDEHAEVLVRFDTGLVARITTSWRSEEPQWDAQASSPEGVVRVELIPELRLERNGAEVPLPGIPEGVPRQLEELGYLPQVEAFALDLRDGRPPAIGASFGRSILDLTCAAYASAGAGGEWVELPFTGPRDRTPLELWRSG